MELNITLKTQFRDELKMNGEDIENQEFVKFWKFWLWQYVSRNAEYQEAHHNYINAQVPEEFIGIASKLFQCEISEQDIDILLNCVDGRAHFNDFCSQINIENNIGVSSKIHQFGEATKRWRNDRRAPFDNIFLCSPKDPTEENDSTQILNDAMANSLNTDINNFKPHTFEKDTVETIEPAQFSYFVDTEIKPLEQVIAEVSYWYVRHKYLSSRNDQENASCRFMKDIIKNSYPGFRLDHEDRAIGLWIWDRMQEMEESDAKYTISQAIRDLYKTHDLNRLGYGSLSTLPTSSENPRSTVKRLTRYYNAANNSIKNRMIMPLESS